jgi:hypothetical protein
MDPQTIALTTWPQLPIVYYNKEDSFFFFRRLLEGF